MLRKVRGALGSVLTARTRCEPVHGARAPTSLSAHGPGSKSRPHHLAIPTVYENVRFDLEDTYLRTESYVLGDTLNQEVVLVQFTEFNTTGLLLIIN